MARLLKLDLLPSSQAMNFGPDSEYLWSTQALTWNGSTFVEPEADFPLVVDSGAASSHRSN
jgi:hypothetical protein